MKVKDFVIFLILLSAPFKCFCAEYPVEIYDEELHESAKGPKWSLGVFGKHWRVCKISGLYLTKENYVIQPIGENVNAVTIFKLERSTVPVLSKAICDKLPNLKAFQAISQSIEEIEEGAFEGCKGLVYIDLQENNFLKLDKNTFKELENLRYLLLSGGHIPIVNLDVTNAKKLEFLGMPNMNISIFPAETLHGLENLEVLSLFSNNLFDLDVEKVLKFTTNLQEIHLSFNNLKCSRVKEIIPIFKMKNIMAAQWFHPKDIARRNHYPEPEHINGFMCLSDQQWTSEILNSELLSYDEQKLINKDDKNSNELIKKLKVLTIEHKNASRTQSDNNLNVETKIDLFIETIEKMLNQTSEDLGNKLEKINSKLENLTMILYEKIKNEGGKNSEDLQHNLVNSSNVLDEKN